MSHRISVCALLLIAASPAVAQTKVGPARGAVLVVGGGAVGPEINDKFIALAGGPEALIIVVPTAGGAATYGAETPSSRSLKAAGARNVLVLHTIDRAVADADSFVAPIKRAGAIWFEGGRQWHLVDSYAGTKSEKEFNQVLARGGVIGGSSAGASILSSFLLRGAREGNTIVIAPQYLVGFGYLHNVAIDQHVVARSRLRDLADSLLPRYPNILGISEDEGTAWLVQGDHGEILGRNKAFVYGGRENDPGRPFLTLHPGDSYNLAERVVIHRAIDGSPLTERFVDDLIAPWSREKHAPVTILVAQNGKVLVNKGYGVTEQMVKKPDSTLEATYMPVTTTPQFALGAMTLAFHSIVAQTLVLDKKLSFDDTLVGAGGKTVRHYLTHLPTASDYAAFTTLAYARGGLTTIQRVFGPIGMHQTVSGVDGTVASDVDELYRLELGLETSAVFVRDTSSVRSGTAGLDTSLGWMADQFKGLNRLSEYAVVGGRRGAFMRFPDQRTTIIVLTDSDSFDAKGVAEQIASRLLLGGKH